MGLFDSIEHPSDPNLRQFLAGDGFQAERAHCEELWRDFAPVAGSDFLSRLPHAFAECYWEMFVYLRMKRDGHDVRVVAGGPDFVLRDGERSIWVEATMPGPGDGPDALSRELPSVFRIPEDKIVLRLVSVLTAKSNQLLHHKDSGLVGPSDACVVAISSGLVPLAGFEGDHPPILAAVAPIGPWTVTIDSKTLEPIAAGYAHRPHIRKRMGGLVPTGAFTKPEFSHVSAVIYTNRSPWSLSEETFVVHNPMANAPLTQCLISGAREFCITDTGYQEILR